MEQKETAINAAQVQVKFNKAVDSSTVLDSDGTLKNGVVTLTKVDGTGVVTISDASIASLSTDGKTLTINAASGAFNNVKFVVGVPANTVKATDGKFVAGLTSDVLTASDTTAPAFANTTVLNASTVRVYFSEPLSSAGNWTFTKADGSSVTVTPVTTNISKGYVDLNIDSAVLAGTAITATIVGATDYAGNLLNPNPTTVNFTKGQLDGTKPTVSTVTSIGLNKFEVKFSEEVQSLTATDFSIDGVARTANDATPALAGTEAVVTQDTTDKTKYVVEVASLSAGIHTVGLAASAVNDLSGEANLAFSRVLEFKADAVNPTVVSTEVKTESGSEYLYVNFSESVTAGTITTLTARQVKNFVTSTGTIDLSGLTPVANTDNKQYKVALSAVNFTTGGTTAAISAGAAYTVTLNGFTDASSNALADTTVNFSRAADTDTNKPAVLRTTDTGETGNLVAGNGIKVVDNDTIRVTFDRALDGATAINKANYLVNGLTVESATLLTGNVVEIKLAKNTNTLDGLRNVTISGVKSAAGVVMDTYATTEYFVENVKPTFTAALSANDTITLTFSENVSGVTETPTAAADFKVLIDGVDVTTFATPVVVTEAGADGQKTFTLTLGRAVTAAEYAKTITIESATGQNVVDSKGNALSFTSVTVTK